MNCKYYREPIYPGSEFMCVRNVKSIEVKIHWTRITNKVTVCSMLLPVLLERRCYLVVILSAWSYLPVYIHKHRSLTRCLCTSCIAGRALHVHLKLSFETGHCMLFKLNRIYQDITLEIKFDAPTNAGQHVTSNIACARCMRCTKHSVLEVAQIALCCYDVT